jgi:hypothetical protein
MAVVNQGFPTNQLNPNQVPPGPPTQFDPNQIPPNQGVPIQLNSNQGPQKKTYFQLLKELQNKAIENMGKLTGPIRERAQALAQKAINTAKNVGTQAASTAMSVGEGVITKTPIGFVAKHTGALNAAKAQAKQLAELAAAKAMSLRQGSQAVNNSINNVQGPEINSIPLPEETLQAKSNELQQQIQNVQQASQATAPPQPPVAGGRRRTRQRRTRRRRTRQRRTRRRRLTKKRKRRDFSRI